MSFVTNMCVCVCARACAYLHIHTFDIMSFPGIKIIIIIKII